MRKIWCIRVIMILVCVAGAVLTSAARQYFDKSKDLLLANFDLKPDEDDVHAAAALACMLQHSDLAGVNYYVVAGAVGDQGGKFISTAIPGYYNLLFGPQNEKWTDAHNEWNASVTRVKNKVKATLNAGGKVFIQEAGQSDFTSDVLHALQAEGVSSAVTKSRIIVVQHSNYNEQHSTDLSWVKANTDYVRIEDGNGANSTPDYNEKNTTWMNQAKSSSNSKAKQFWTQADQICDNFTASWENPTIAGGGVDFSDCVENWWIFEIGDKANTVAKFWSRYVTNSTGGNNQAPVVSFAKPVNNQTFAVGANVSVTVNASDDGSIANVRLYLNNVFVRQENVYPYEWGGKDAVLNNMYAGTYTLKAVATDNTGLTSQTSITIKVGAAASCDVPWTGPNYSVTKASKTWTSDPIDISCASAVNISMTAKGTGPMENADYLKISYKVNGGNAVNIFSKTNAFAAQTVSANNISGNTLQIIIEGKTSWGDETYTVSNIRVDAAVKSALVSVAEPMKCNAFSVFPNPVSGKTVRVKFEGMSNEDVQVQFFDISGVLKYTKMVPASGVQQINVESLSPGLYVVKVGTNTQKLMIER